MRNSFLAKIVLSTLPALLISCANPSKTIPGTIYALPAKCDEARQYFDSVRDNDELFDREKFARARTIEINIILKTIAYNWAFNTDGKSEKIILKYTPSDIALKDKEMKSLLYKLEEVNKEKESDHDARLSQSEAMVKKFCGDRYEK